MGYSFGSQLNNVYLTRLNERMMIKMSLRTKTILAVFFIFLSTASKEVGNECDLETRTGTSSSIGR